MHAKNIAIDLLTQFALEVWYGQLDIIVRLIQDELEREPIEPDQSRQVLYLIDRLISYPCMEREKRRSLKSIKITLKTIKPELKSGMAEQLFINQRLDKKSILMGIARRYNHSDERDTQVPNSSLRSNDR